ncbi:penicillin amidase [Knoellia sinensis KCTC 19936]|uniref:Penicillin amidase n=1 Tax=Knoellia sinensis KCTC 19936 TaxID=1385520 RepID=A0A0A0IYE5_9MICO|nr:penicillin acylase family protein [Knoellia sinensis]KGN30220.1 penicillin amidase [Knoellia sinensis KCTC 19936]
MTPQRVARRVALGLLGVIVVAALVLSVVGISLVRRSFPQTEGEVALRGLEANVSVLRDQRGVPQIYGDSVTDIAKAQGFVHAQDRFFEMDFRRHVTAGRVSELVGEAGLEADRAVRTMGWRRVAEAELPTLEPATRTYLQAYADGVNAYLRGRSPSQASLEYVILGARVSDYTIEKWTPADSIAWLKAMAWDLRGDYADELGRARLSTRVSAAQINELYPPYDHANKPILSGQDWSPPAVAGQQASAVPSTAAMRASLRSTATRASAREAADALATPAAQQAYAAVGRALSAVPQLIGRGDGVGSNSWVIGSAKSATGKPLLANDPHLGLGIPSVWYQVGLHCRAVSEQCPLDVAGFSLSGVPGVVIGHNNKVAWGMTNLGPDVSDFYLEKLDGNTVLRGAAYEPLTTRQEVIKVAGGEDETITVRATRHGPLLSDVLGPLDDAGEHSPVPSTEGPQPVGQDYGVSLAWTGLQPSKTADAIFGMNTAQSFGEFREAARDFAVPSQNLIYADVDGHIGYQAPGQVPVRTSAFPDTPPGFWPAPGWDEAYDWKGYVPFEAMPTTLDPAEGFIVAANQAVTASPTPFLTSEWDYGYRSQRIRTLIERATEGGGKITAQQMADIQMDSRNEFAPKLVEALLAVPLEGPDDSEVEVAFTREAQDLLRDWDFTTPADDSTSGAAAAYYNAVWANLLTLLFDDEVPEDLRADGGDRYMAVVGRLLDNPKSAWWDNRQTAGITEGRDEILRQAQVEARLELTRTLGKDPDDWRWGALHRVDLEHRPLGSDTLPGVVRSVFNRGGFELPGGSSIVNANGGDISVGYGVTWGPSMRMVVDLGNLDRSTWINLTGASGHAFNGHYDDQTEDWVEGRQDPWPFTEKAVREATEDELTLVPEGAG